jgi:hypothetical protein
MELWKGIFKVQEECGELIQVAAKACVFPTEPHPDGKGPMEARFHEEIADVYAALDYFLETNAQLNATVISIRRQNKLDQFREWGLTGVHE